MVLGSLAMRILMGTLELLLLHNRRTILATSAAGSLLVIPLRMKVRRL